MPRAVYEQFRKSPDGTWGLRRRVADLEKRAEKDAERVMKRASLHLDHQFAETDIRHLENGPQTAALLREAKSAKLSSERAAHLVGKATYEHSRGELGKLEGTLERRAQKPVIVRIALPNAAEAGRVYVEDSQALQELSAAGRIINGYKPKEGSMEEPVEGLTSKYRSKEGIQQSIDNLQREIDEFDAKTIRLDLGGKMGKKRQAIIEMKADLEKWNKAEQDEKNAREELKAIDKVNILLRPEIENGLRLEPGQLQDLAQSQNLGNFLERLRAQLLALRDRPLTPEQQAVYKQYEELKAKEAQIKTAIDAIR